MFHRPPVVIDSVAPLQGHEGTIVTIKGSGFGNHIRNNCVVIGGMGACARTEPNPTSTEIKVRVGPVAKETEGDLLMWPPALGADLWTEEVRSGGTSLRFSEVALFQNGGPVASAGVSFKLTRVSPNTYAGCVEPSATTHVELGGCETGPVLRVRFPNDFSISAKSSIDICCVLKEPTLSIDFSAAIASSLNDDEECLRAIAKGITFNAGLVGEKVFADVARDTGTGELELYVTKPYLTNGMVTLRFN